MKPLVKPLLNSWRKRVLRKRNNDCWFLAIVLRALLLLSDSGAQMCSVLLSSDARASDRASTAPLGALPKAITVRRTSRRTNLVAAQDRLYCVLHKDLSSIRGPL